MSAEETKALVWRFIDEVQSKGNIDAVDATRRGQAHLTGSWVTLVNWSAPNPNLFRMLKSWLRCWGHDHRCR